jgi:thiamine biosynthesis lipoprotein
MRSLPIRNQRLKCAACSPVCVLEKNKNNKYKPGLCPRCGCDVRATPERCPECGAVPVLHDALDTSIMSYRCPRPAAAIIIVALIAIGAITTAHLMRSPAPRTDTLRSVEPNPDSNPSGPIAVSGPTMGSTWLVRLRRLPAGISPGQVQAAVQEVLDRVEGQMSTYKPDSDLARFNQSRTTDWVAVPDDLAIVVDMARRVSQQSGGAFDVTVGPLVNLWGFGPEHPTGPFGSIPPPAMLAEARRHVNYRLLEARLSEPAIRKGDPMAYVDLSAIAKGYAAELVSRRLDALGAGDYLIAVGGEMRARGFSPLGQPWRVGIETPTPGVRRVLCRVALPAGSLSTSGDYRNFFDQNGRRYSHEIDPATGEPTTRAPASVTVADASGAYADAMATALMVMGPDTGYALALKFGLPVLFILRGAEEFQIRATPEFEKLMIDGPATAPTTQHADDFSEPGE